MTHTIKHIILGFRNLGVLQKDLSCQVALDPKPSRPREPYMCSIRIVRVKEPVKVAFKEPLQEPLKDALKEALKEPLEEPLKEALKEPLEEPLEEALKEKPLEEPSKEAEASDVTGLGRVKLLLLQGSAGKLGGHQGLQKGSQRTLRKGLYGCFQKCEYSALNGRILIIRTPNKVPLIVGNSHMSIRGSDSMAPLLAAAS